MVIANGYFVVRFGSFWAQEKNGSPSHHIKGVGITANDAIIDAFQQATSAFRILRYGSGCNEAVCEYTWTGSEWDANTPSP